MKKTDLKTISKFLSLVLRHQPEVLSIQPDKNGWVNVDELISKMNEKDFVIDFEILKKVVDENDKKRFIFNENFEKIRANQGHSIEVDLSLKPIEPPEILYHGTSIKNLNSIFNEGIDKRKRNHVHLSKDMETAIKVGSRHGKPVVLKIKSKLMYEEGQNFYLSENNVWLTDYVDPKYIEKNED